MTKRIQGITIELDGDSTPLQKALKDVDKTSQATTKELGQINRALKFDPGNTTLLAQKFDVLQDSISNTSTRLDVLKKAQAEVDRQFKAGEIDASTYREFQREIEITEGRLQSFKKQAENLKIQIEATGDTSFIDRMNAKLEELGKTATEVGKKLKDVGDSTKQLGEKMTVGLTLPIVGLGTAAAKTFIDFDAQMSRVGAIADATADQLENMKKVALDLGASTSKSASEVAIGMENLAAMGFTVNEVMGAMPGVISAAEASGADMATTADVMAAALNAFSLDATEASRVADVLAQTANVSAADITDMGYAFKYAAPIANTLGISMEELAAATGLMADSGIEGSQAGTSLRAGLIALVKPAEKTSKMMNEMGLQFEDAEGNFIGLSGVIEELSKSMEGYTDSQKLATLAALVGTEAASGFLILMESGPEEINKMTEALENAGGASERTAAMMKDNLAGSLEEMGGALETAAITIGALMAPIIREIAVMIQGLVEQFTALSPEIQTTILIVAGLVAALGPALVIIGTLISSIGTIVGAFGAMSLAIAEAGGIIAMLTSPIGIVIASIAALIAIVILFKDDFIAIWNDHLKPLLDEFAQFIMDTVLPAFQEGFNMIADVVKSAFEIIKQVWDSILKPVVETIMKVIKSDLMPVFKDGFKTISDVVKTSFDLIKTVWNNILHPIIKLIIEVIKHTLLPAFQFAFGAISSVVSTSFSAISGFWNNTLKPILTGITDYVGGVFTGNWERAWSGVVSIFGGIFKGIEAAAKAPLNFVIGMINAVIDGMNSLSIDIPDWVPGFGGSTWGINIPRIPMLAKGTDYFRGGYAIVGEEGPELVELPTGAKVHPNNKTQQMMGGITQHITIVSPTPISPSENARKMKQAAQQLAMEWGV